MNSLCAIYKLGAPWKHAASFVARSRIFGKSVGLNEDLQHTNTERMHKEPILQLLLSGLDQQKKQHASVLACGIMNSKESLVHESARSYHAHVMVLGGWDRALVSGPGFLHVSYLVVTSLSFSVLQP